MQEIEQCLTRKDYAGAAAAQAELVQRRSAPGHEKRGEKQLNGEKNERVRKALEEEYARKIDELLQLEILVKEYQRDYRAANRDKLKEKQRKYEATPQARAKTKERGRKYSRRF